MKHNDEVARAAILFLDHGRGPLAATALDALLGAAAASPATSGSGRKSMTLNPSGFQLRVCGFFDGSE